MLTLRKAVFEGITSPTLMSRWHNDEYETVLNMNRLVRERKTIQWIWLSLVIFATSASLANRFLDHTGNLGTSVGLMVGICIVCILLLHICLAWGPMSIFLKDCKELSKYIDKPGFYGSRTLLQVAEMKLVSIATEIVFIEIPMSYEHPVETTSGVATNEHRARFKKAFEAMKKFGLTEKAWDPYFNKASIKAKSYGLR